MEKSHKIKSLILWMLFAVVVQAQQPPFTKNIELKEPKGEVQKKLKFKSKELRSVPIKMSKVLFRSREKDSSRKKH